MVFSNYLYLIHLKGLVYDLGDSSKWEYMLPSNDKPMLVVPQLGAEANDDEVNF